MARKPKVAKYVETLVHDEATRKNIPTAEYQSVMQKEHKDPVRVTYPRGGSALPDEKHSRNQDLDPQLVWRGKDQQDWSDLVVNAPPLYIQEKVHPKVLIDDLKRQTEQVDATQTGFTTDLFGDFNGIAEGADKTEFYQHEGKWQNRMILGDSLQVMASLAEREGLRGKVQCIYFDPPYGIKFNSNFQWSSSALMPANPPWVSPPGQASSHAKVILLFPRIIWPPMSWKRSTALLLRICNLPRCRHSAASL